MARKIESKHSAISFTHDDREHYTYNRVVDSVLDGKPSTVLSSLPIERSGNWNWQEKDLFIISTEQ